jgi:phosphonate transport system permease protein
MSQNRPNRKKETYRKSLVSPLVAALLSLLVPGLGQIAAGRWRRGFLLFGSFFTTLALVIWRIRLAGKRYDDLLEIVTKAVRLEPFLGILLVAIVVLWIWIIFDAARQARPERRDGAGIFAWVILVFFLLGWQITEIDIYKAVTQLPEAIPPLMEIIWPWEAAVTREDVYISAFANVETPCTEDPPPPPEEVLGEPYILVEPSCGELSKAGVPGSVLAITGRGYVPDAAVVFWWEDPLGGEFRIWQQGEYLQVMADGQGEFETEILMPIIEVPTSAGPGPYEHTLEARQIVAAGPRKPSEELLLAVSRMIETIFLGMMATVFGVVLAVPVSFVASRNLMSQSRVTMVIYYATRTVLNIVRSIEPLIWAIIATIWVGLGPFAGVIALTLHSVAALGKLYSEAIEGIDPGPIEAIQATGANWLQTIAFAVVPQMIPPFVSFTIYRWDINVRMSTIIGAVGGGGIGFLLIQWIRLLDFKAAGIAVWFIAITVAVLDYVSAEIRARFV